MALAFVFIFGIANFAMHRAVRESGHPMLEQVAPFMTLLRGTFSYLIEGLVLVTALGFAASGGNGAAFVYFLYTVANGIAAWLVLSHRI